MNADELLDLALGRAEPPGCDTLELRIADDPEAARTLDRLRRRLDLLLDDGLDDLEPPRGLASRTLARVAAAPPRRNLLEFAPVRVPFRWTDVAVAAGIFAAGVLTLLPAFQRGKAQVEQAACTYNLQQLGYALRLYSNAHGAYPYVKADDPSPRAGAFAVLLHDVGLLDKPEDLDCPANGTRRMPAALPHYRDLCRAESQAAGCPPCLHHIDYAYSLGYEHGPGRPGPAPAERSGVPQHTIPLLADRPADDAHGRILPGNSLNHAGHGQNVLFGDGHVSWHPDRRLNPLDADMYANDRHTTGPGLSPHDAVLVPATFRIDGRY